MIKVGIVGGTGYTAGELIRCLVYHSEVSIDFIYSHSQPGEKVATVHHDLFGNEALIFTDKINPQVDVLFLCMGHGHAKSFLLKNKFSSSTKVIDLSNEFRLQPDADFEDKHFIYGLVALNKAKICKAQYIANPGCFATAIQLALLPLAHQQLLKSEVHIHAITGSTGAGQTPAATTHFSWRNNNVSVYKAFTHQHLDEIRESVVSLQKDFKKGINFLPLRGDFTRGILASVYVECSLSEEALLKLFKEFYSDSPFTKVTNEPVHLKQVVNTNYCLLQVQKIEGKVLITSVIDNLLKGAAGQAIQNMNLMCGLDEKSGLALKASFF